MLIVDCQWFLRINGESIKNPTKCEAKMLCLRKSLDQALIFIKYVSIIWNLSKQSIIYLSK